MNDRLSADAGNVFCKSLIEPDNELVMQFADSPGLFGAIIGFFDTIRATVAVLDELQDDNLFP
jgi:hypothetical protein